MDRARRLTMATTPIKQREPEQRVTDPASLEALKKAEAEGVETSFSRVNTQAKLCAIGEHGLCCRLCHMGPCRLTKKAPLGVCGADGDTVVARNYLRQVAAGAAAHSEHGRHLVMMLGQVARGRGGAFEIKDEAALRRSARRHGVDEAGRPAPAVAGDLSELLLGELSRQEGRLASLDLAPLKRQGIWRSSGVEPGGVDRPIIECLHRTSVGVDHDHQGLLRHAMRTALADGWGGSRFATEVSDILFGTPRPVGGRVNLGVLGEDTVNVLIHGHEPGLAEMLAAAAHDPQVAEAARAAGATGLNLAGICCTASEMLARHGVPVAGNFLQQELALITGAVEMMVIDVQCCMPSLPRVAAAYHTEIVSTSEIAHTVGATRQAFSMERAYEDARALLLRAVERYPRRDPGKVKIPEHHSALVAGF